MDEKSDKPTSIERFLGEAIPMTGEFIGYGATIGTGFLIAGPYGAAVAAVGGNVVSRKATKLLNDMAQRFLSHREGARVGNLLYFANEKYKSMIDNDQVLRDDGFFAGSLTERSPFEEIFEGFLISAKSDYEEKKLPYYGNLMVNTWFRPDIDRYQANLLLKVFENLSYRQLCIMALIVRKENFGLKLDSYRKPNRDEDRYVKLNKKLISVLNEIKNLYSQDLIAMHSGGVILSLPAIKPKQLVLVGVGALIHELAELDGLYMKNYGDLKSIGELLGPSY